MFGIKMMDVAAERGGPYFYIIYGTAAKHKESVRLHRAAQMEPQRTSLSGGPASSEVRLNGFFIQLGLVFFFFFTP